jgi:hypothetical protein
MCTIVNVPPCFGGQAVRWDDYKGHVNVELNLIKRVIEKCSTNMKY